MENIEGEIIVVDNNSTDNSTELIQKEYSNVRLIANNFNAGFSKANNQGIKIAKGRYVLLLNPDTVVEEKCFEKCIEYMDDHDEVGGLGVKMIDGSGTFLPESKRGLPTPLVAFYKIFGLSRLFPKSKRFGAYHLGYLPMNEINEVDILSGAFMWLRKSVIDKIGGLDEAFFMYGEDIDLSYRIVKAGYKNIYFPASEIIHFKGESTKKSSVNYVLVFYRAMIIFAKKHFSDPNARIFSFLINTAVYFRAFLALIRRFVEKSYMPLLDAGIMWVFLKMIKLFYASKIVGYSNYYPDEVELMAFPLMITSWVFAQFLFGGYHQPTSMKNVFKGLAVGAVIIFISYSMLDEKMRFSRAIVAFSVAGSFVLMPSLRLLLNKFRLFKLIRITEITTGIVGSVNEIIKVKKILSSSSEKKKHLLYINPLKKSQSIDKNDEIHYSASLYQLKDLIQIKSVDELIFCMKDVVTSELIKIMQLPFIKRLGIYLNPGDGSYMLKSSSIHSIGDYILPESNPVMKSSFMRSKRFLEIVISIFMLIFSPLILFLYRNPKQFLKNMWQIMSGKIALVGYTSSDGHNYLLPITQIESIADDSIFEKKKMEYILNYGIEKDLEIWLSNLNQIDRMPLGTN